MQRLSLSFLFILYLFVGSVVLPSIFAYGSNEFDNKRPGTGEKGKYHEENNSLEKSSNESKDGWEEVNSKESEEECDQENETDEQHKAHEGRIVQKKSYGQENHVYCEEITPDESCEEKIIKEYTSKEFDYEWNSNECDEEEELDESGQENEMEFEGAYAPVFTPVDENNELNFTVIPKYVEHLHKSGVTGILVAGKTGEGTTMTIQQRKRLLVAYLTEARKRCLKVIVHIGGTNVPDAKELAKHAQDVKADAIMAIPQIYYKPKSIEQLVGYLELLSKSAPRLPIFYYHSPQKTGVYVNIRAFFRYASAKIPNFMGIKGRFESAQNIADLLRGRQKMFVSGNSIASNALMGFDASITAVTNMFMDQVKVIQNAVRSGDFEKARMWQNRLDNIIREIMTIGNESVPLLKATMEIVTDLKLGPAMPPEKRITTRQRKAIRKVLEKYHVEIKSR